MVKSEYRRKLWYTIVESVKNVSKLEARAMFFQKCQNFNIVPTTKNIKPMKNSNPKLCNKYKNVAKNASRNNLQIAALDAKTRAREAKNEHTNFIESMNLNEKTLSSLEKLTSIISKQQ